MNRPKRTFSKAFYVAWNYRIESSRYTSVSLYVEYAHKRANQIQFSGWLRQVTKGCVMLRMEVDLRSLAIGRFD